MDRVKEWFLVDDLKEEAEAFAEKLRDDGGLAVRVLNPDEAKNKLLRDGCEPNGVLMDVDLSSIQGELGSGPGIAQDIRVKQKSQEIPEYPVIRFAALKKVKQNVRGDPTSDDLFDIKVQKERVARDITSLSEEIKGVRDVYDFLSRIKRGSIRKREIFGCTDEEFECWGNEAFCRRILGSVNTSVHVAAGYFMRNFLVPSGLLIDEVMLSVRLGVDYDTSGGSWLELKKNLDFHYQGAGGGFFRRWWAFGLEEWWFNNINAEEPLVGLPATERVKFLERALGIKNITPLDLPRGSPGVSPWRLCTLSLEKEPSEIVPIDPAHSVKISPDVDVPDWIDPMYASFQEALRNREDFRLDMSDVESLSKRYL
ncbi:hypothetical protein QC589_13520 [Halomonas elongata]|uniref:hypothetical protein n=1 Tax=Halomonas elongata TaxID=2746 RepID=UPI00335D07B7